MPLTEKTVPYKTWIKRSVVEALRQVFNDHVDELLRETKTTIEYPNEEAKYPAVVVRFYERQIKNAGIAHEEFIQLEEGGASFKFKHYFYEGDLELVIHALSSVDRDLISDSIVQTIGMGELEEYTRRFFDRIYTDVTQFPEANWNHLNINSDILSGFGETQKPAPWLPEDTLVYQSSYRIGIGGGFYSLPPELGGGLDYIEEVDTYPYIVGLEPKPTGADDPATWIPPDEDE
jgi:hypothetical protein